MSIVYTLDGRIDERWLNLAQAYEQLSKLYDCMIRMKPQQVDLWVRMVHVCVGTAACPRTADFRLCAPQAKIYRFVPFKKKRFL